MADLWTDYTDMLITQFDGTLGKNYKVSLRELLTDPLKYAGEDGISTQFQNMREDLIGFIDDSLGGFKEQKEQYEAELAKCHAITKQLSASISSKAALKKVPVIKPISMNTNKADEIINVDSASAEVVTLVEKLAQSSFLVADFTRDVDGKNVGSWLFDGTKNFIINVYLPPNEYASLTASKDELTALFEVAARVFAVPEDAKRTTP